MEGRIAVWYARKTLKDAAEFRRLAERLSVRIPTKSRILEVAPGPGYLRSELGRRGSPVHAHSGGLHDGTVQADDIDYALRRDRDRQDRHGSGTHLDPVIERCRSICGRQHWPFSLHYDSGVRMGSRSDA